MSTQSSSEFNTQHRYDNDSSLDLVTVPPSKIFKHSLTEWSGTSLRSGDHDVTTGHQSVGDVQSPLADGSGERYDKTTPCFQGQARSQEIEATNKILSGGDAVSAEGHSVSTNRQRCIHCGCESSHSMNIQQHTAPTNYSTDAVVAELDDKQGSAATHGAQCSGENSTHSQGRVDTHQSECGGRSEPVQGRVGTVELRCGGRGVYNGVISQELCQQIVQLLNDLDSTTDLNLQVDIICSYISYINM